MSETFFPGEGDIDVAVYQTTGECGFREILTTPFTHHMYTHRAPIDVDGAKVCACSSGTGSVRKYPRPRLYVKYANEMAQLALPHGTWSVTTMVFSRRR
jgi:hypothetical protein